MWNGRVEAANPWSWPWPRLLCDHTFGPLQSFALLVVTVVSSRLRAYNRSSSAFGLIGQAVQSVYLIAVTTVRVIVFVAMEVKVESGTE